MTISQISRRKFLAGSAVIAGALGGGIELVLPDPARAENAKVASPASATPVGSSRNSSWKWTL